MRLAFIFSYALVLFSSFSHGAIPVVKTITVDNKGGGDFKTIQAAINSVPKGNVKWINIRIKAGVYQEKVNITADKGFLLIEGEGAAKTIIQYGDYAPASLSYLSWDATVTEEGDDEVPETACFTVSAPNIIIKGIKFKNSYSSKVPGRAIAARIAGDKTSFYNCSFIGIQDTLNDHLGRHYFKDCYIEGAVDFIFGQAQSLYEDCTLATVPSMASAGWVTAHGRPSPNDPSGFIFKNCKLTGTAKTYLGRAWTAYSRVLFYQTDMSNIVVPAGWDYWRDPNKGAHTTYVESWCKGPGSDTSKRVPWEKKLSAAEVYKLAGTSFVDDGWLNQQLQLSELAGDFLE